MRLTNFIGLVALVATSVPARARERVINERAATIEAEYDYVVVGSGPGGAPLACRLAIAGYTVLLLDAGNDQGNTILQEVPALQLQSTQDPLQQWDYYVHHYADNARQELDSKFVWQTPDGGTFVNVPGVNISPPAGSTPLGILYPRAGTLGGCAGHNAMITIYPHDSDWANIASITGDSTWAPDNMRTYFERLERCEYLPNDVVGHGFDGWLEDSLTDLDLVVEDLKLVSLVVAAATAMGKSLFGIITSTVVGLGEILTLDINADTPTRDQQQDLYQVPIAVGASSVMRTGPRDFIMATVNATNPDGSRKYSLDISLNTLVTKVRFDTSGATPQAVGVNYLSGQSLYRADPRSSSASAGIPGSVNATREVILSAGTFNTPQLLKLSGIGPAAELDSFSIPMIVDLPGVGTNMQDRYEVTIVGKTTSDFSSTAACTFLRTQPDPCLVQYETAPLPKGPTPLSKGIYTTNGIAIAIVRKSSTAAASDPADLLITGAPAFFSGYYPGFDNFALSDARHWAWITLKAHARNTAGTVQLRSADPQDTPIINFNYFDTGTTTDGADELDLQAVYEAMEFSRQVFQNLVPLDGGFSEVWPDPLSFVNASTEAGLKEFIKNEAWGHHASCTCPIGADDDPMAVLDSRFNVRGTTGLRVVDASVFPQIPGFYIAVPIYMVSEKASDVILEDAMAGVGK
ncbi:MAG: hypothetical protein MMC33_008319 [Icmadophila ericetorum]|nr:hypothetical protein [Icmadophila ericetorum]